MQRFLWVSANGKIAKNLHSFGDIMVITDYLQYSDSIVRDLHDPCSTISLACLITFVAHLSTETQCSVTFLASAMADQF